MLRQNNQYLVLVTISFILGIASLVSGFFDKGFNYRWVILSFHLSSVLIIPLGLIYIKAMGVNWGALRNIINKSKHQWLIFLLFVVLALATRFIFLDNYPFVSLGDEVRDGGLNALQIADSEIKNIFGYGRYDAHGLIIPTIVVWFYKLLGSSVISYRLPAAIASFIGIMLVWYFTKKKFGNLAAYSATLILITNPVHLFYSRTELSVILSSLLLIVLLFLSDKVYKDKQVIWLYLLGIFIGFSFNFHASIKAAGLLVLAVTMFNLLIFRRKTVKRLSLVIFIILSAVIIGFGPRLFYTTPNIFFHTSRILTNQQCQLLDLEETCIGGLIGETSKKYIKSIGVWFYQPTSSWYPDHKPLFPKALFLFFLIGILFLFLKAKKDPLSITILFLTFSLPLTNSALTDMVNADHRLVVLLPLGSIIMGIGLSKFWHIIKIRPITVALVTICVFYLLMDTFGFYIEKRADKHGKVVDYLMMHTIYQIKNEINGTAENLTLSVSSVNYREVNYLHYQEQRAYFLPKINFNIKQNPNLADNEIVIGDREISSVDKLIEIKCQSNYFNCPKGYTAGFKIHYISKGKNIGN